MRFIYLGPFRPILTQLRRTCTRTEGAVPVALVTPYGATKSDFFAVGAYHKLGKGKKIGPGNVGHDRIQQGHAGQSIGEEIRHWYNLPTGDFERIDVEIETLDDMLYLTPRSYKLASEVKKHPITVISNPLTFTREHKSSLWIEQLANVKSRNKGLVQWSL